MLCLLCNNCLMTQNQNWHQGYDILAIKTEKIMYSKGTPICTLQNPFIKNSVKPQIVWKNQTFSELL